MKTKRIFEFDDYREYLRYAYALEKEANPNFSLRYFSRLAGFKSHSVLRQVMHGQRNIAAPSIAKFAKALKLNKEETSFFRSLVLFNQAATIEEREKFAEEILRSRGYKRFHSPLRQSQYNYFAHWFFVVVRELVGLPGFKEDPEWISKSIMPGISVQDAKRALEELQKLELLRRDSSGKLVQAESHLETPDEVISVSFAKCHKELLQLASSSIERIRRDRRDISGVTFSMSAATVQKIKERIHAFRKEIVDIAAGDQSPDAIYQLNLQLFPLAQTSSNTEET